MSQAVRHDPYRLTNELFGARYRLESFAGAGSFGAVYRATDTRLNRTVAVKILKPDLNDAEAGTARELFQREALTAGRLVHPHIVAVTDTGEEAGFAYMVMEWLEGRTLEEELRERGSFSAEETCSLLASIADALQTAHDAGVVHRDIKPSNIHLGRQNRTHVKVLDFGIAKVITAASDAAASRIAGTLYYMSPEQISGASLDRRTDIYSLGVMLYQLLSGRLPFSQMTQGQIVNAHFNEMPTPLASLRPDLPLAVSRVVERAMAKDANERQPSVTQLYQEFVHAVGAPENLQTVVGLNIPSHTDATATEQQLTTTGQSSHARTDPAGALTNDYNRNTSHQNPYSGTSFEQASPQFDTNQNHTTHTAQQQQQQPLPPTVYHQSNAQSATLAATQFAPTAQTLPPTIVAPSNQMDRTLAVSSERAAQNQSAPKTKTSQTELRSMRNYAIVGALLLLSLSAGVGLLARWAGWSPLPYAYDEFILQLIPTALRDCLFGAFLGASFAGWRASVRENRTANVQIGNVVSGQTEKRGGWSIRSLVWHGAAGAALFMLPFVLLRTSMIFLPFSLAVLGFSLGAMVYGGRFAIGRLNTPRA